MLGSSHVALRCPLLNPVIQRLPHINDRDIALRVQDLQARARDYGFMELPGYMAWSERQLLAGGNETLIAHLDASSMWLLPEDAAALGEADHEAWLAELREELGLDDED